MQGALYVTINTTVQCHKAAGFYIEKCVLFSESLGRFAFVNTSLCISDQLGTSALFADARTCVKRCQKCHGFLAILTLPAFYTQCTDKLRLAGNFIFPLKKKQANTRSISEN